MFLVALTAAVAAPERVVAHQAKATVIIQKSTKVTAEGWTKAPAFQKDETTIRGERGETIAIRLIEHQ